MRVRGVVARTAAFAVLAGLVAVAPAAASSRGATRSSIKATGGSTKSSSAFTYRGTVDLKTLPGQKGKENTNDGLQQYREVPDREDVIHSRSSQPKGSSIPNPPSTKVVFDNEGTSGFTGIVHRDQRQASGGNQFSVEPPDSGCIGVSDFYRFEAVNDAVTVFDYRSLQVVPVVGLNAFFGYPPNIDRTTGKFGPDIFDPTCYRDPQSGRFYLTVDNLAEDPDTGDFTGESGLDIAVSASANPTRRWYLYHIDTTNSDHPGCSDGCFADHPLDGADAFGYYVTVNEFGIFSSAFNGSQIYAMPKSKLESGDATGLQFYFTELADAHYSYSVRAALSPDSKSWDMSNGGTEYFLSSYDDPNPVNQVGLFALTNTSALDSGGRPDLHSALVQTEVYSDGPNFALPKAEQKQGQTPLGDLVGEQENALDAGDTQMQEVNFAAGDVWGALGTAVQADAQSGDLRDGVAWFRIHPDFTKGFGGTVVNQGYVAIRGNNLIYPAIGVDGNGNGIIGFSISGPRFFPSAGMIRIGAAGTGAEVHVDALGVRPEDGFTCYEALVGDRTRGCRWGDYSWAQAAPSGNIWYETEYISNSPRTFFANWSTWIGRADALPVT